ncbi:NAD-dependent epimerase/dehydratase family protein [Paraglaciecola aestuariivivens]
MPKSAISVIGCGWLGLPLARKLQSAGHTIVASCTTQAKAEQLNKQGIHTLVYDIAQQPNQAKLAPLFNSDTLILNIPFGRRQPSNLNFIRQINQLLSYAVTQKINKVLFISSSSVYGEPNGIVTEACVPQPQTESAKANLAIENLVKQTFSQHCILRLAGLVGTDRHPVNYLAGKKQLKQAHKVVNLVHQTDVIQAVLQIIHQGLWSDTLHLSANHHPSRQDYYTLAAKRLGLALPEFSSDSKNETGKTIDASESLAKLNMSLAYPSPLDMLGSK